MTPWDLGQPTPILVHLHQTGALPKGRALVPGCGSVSSMVHSYSQDITFSHINSISYIFMQVLSPLHVNILYLFPFSWFFYLNIFYQED